MELFSEIMEALKVCWVFALVSVSVCVHAHVTEVII